MTLLSRPHSEQKIQSGDRLILYPGGYPVTIDVTEKLLDGAGTAMHFVLPLNGHNFPLTHAHEHKLVMALDGSLLIKRGEKTLAILHRGQAALLAPKCSHRIQQLGASPSMVGIALWPGAVEHAFRAIAARVATHGFRREDVVALLADYGIEWASNAVPIHGDDPVVVHALADLLPALPPALAAALVDHWPPRGLRSGSMDG